MFYTYMHNLSTPFLIDSTWKRTWCLNSVHVGYTIILVYYFVTIDNKVKMLKLSYPQINAIIKRAREELVFNVALSYIY